MAISRWLSVAVVATTARLAACATPPGPDRTAEALHCDKTHKCRVIAFHFEGQCQTTTVKGTAGELRFTRTHGRVWAWERAHG